MVNLRKSVGDRIRSIRKMKSLTQQQLAELSNLDDSYIGSVERGERNISIDTLEKVIIALEIQPAELFRLDDQNDNLERIRQEAIDEFRVIISGLSNEDIITLRRINQEVRRAFK